MTRFLRVRLFLLPATVLGALLTSPSPMAVLRAQADQAPPANWGPDAQAPDVADWSDGVPAHVAVVDGSAWLGRDNTEEVAVENVPLLSGDRIRTARGRLEVLFDDGSALDVDENTDIDLLSDSLVRLQTGRVRFSLARSADAADYRVDAAGTTVILHPGGEYRVGIEDLSRTEPNVVVSVMRGSAEIASPFGRTLIRPGYEAAASARSAPSAPYIATAAALDGFDRWAEQLRGDRAGVASARYLPAEVRSYGGVLDHNGDWQFDASYGYVWYPHVDTNWRPYYQGEWSYVASYGWFWVGSDRWSWPTHHYGRWGLAGARWYWIPGQHWGPAWVSWASAPDYVSWCPLGYNNLPIVSINVGYVSSPWRAWTAVPISRFGSRIVVNARSRAYAVPTSERFVERRAAPFRPVSIRAGAQPLHSPGFRATTASSSVPRTGMRSPMSAGGDTRVMTAGARRGTAEDRRTPPRDGVVPAVPATASTALDRGMSRTDRRSDAPVNPASPASGVIDRAARGRSTAPASSPQENGTGRGYRRAPVPSAPAAAPVERSTPIPWYGGRPAQDNPPAPRPNPNGEPRASSRAPGGGMPTRGEPVEAPRQRPEPTRAEPTRSESPRTESPRSAPPRSDPRSEAPRQEGDRSSGRSASSNSGGDHARSRH